MFTNMTGMTFVAPNLAVAGREEGACPPARATHRHRGRFRTAQLQIAD